MDSQPQQISFYIEERQDVISWAADSVSLATLQAVATFISNNIKQQYQTDVLSLRDQENQHYELDQVIEFHRPHIFITIPQNHAVKTRTTNEDRETRSVYNVEENQLVISKFKGKRRTETVTYPMQIIRNLNQQYLETLQKLLDNDGVLTPPKRNSIEIKTSQQPQEPESPKFGQSSKLREAGNDGVSPSWVLKKSPSVKYELKPYTLKELAQHNRPDDAWICINQKIYDVTNYLDKHPGGREKLMLGVGTDGTSLFMQHHPWVNAHYLLEKFQVGFLVNFK